MKDFIEKHNLKFNIQQTGSCPTGYAATKELSWKNTIEQYRVKIEYKNKSGSFYFSRSSSSPEPPRPEHVLDLIIHGIVELDAHIAPPKTMGERQLCINGQSYTDILEIKRRIKSVLGKKLFKEAMFVISGRRLKRELENINMISRCSGKLEYASAGSSHWQIKVKRYITPPMNYRETIRWLHGFCIGLVVKAEEKEGEENGK